MSKKRTSDEPQDGGAVAVESTAVAELPDRRAAEEQLVRMALSHARGEPISVAQRNALMAVAGWDEAAWRRELLLQSERAKVLAHDGEALDDRAAKADVERCEKELDSIRAEREKVLAELNGRSEKAKARLRAAQDVLDIAQRRRMVLVKSAPMGLRGRLVVARQAVAQAREAAQRAERSVIVWAEKRESWERQAAAHKPHTPERASCEVNARTSATEHAKAQADHRAAQQRAEEAERALVLLEDEAAR